MTGADETLLGAFIGLAGFAGFAAIVVPVLGSRNQKRLELARFETLLVLSALVAAGFAVANTVTVLHANQALQQGIPAKVYVPLVLAVLVDAFLGLLVRSPGDSVPQLLTSIQGRLALLMVFGALVGILALVLPLSTRSLIYWAAFLLLVAALLAILPERIVKAATALLDRATEPLSKSEINKLFTSGHLSESRIEYLFTSGQLSESDAEELLRQLEDRRRRHNAASKKSDEGRGQADGETADKTTDT